MEDVRFNGINKTLRTWTRKLSIQLNLAHVATKPVPL